MVSSQHSQFIVAASKLQVQSILNRIGYKSKRTEFDFDFEKTRMTQ